MKIFNCEDCGAHEGLQLKSSYIIYDIETKTMRTETTYLCTKCKDERKEKHNEIRVRKLRSRKGINNR